ncbi:MAG: hypothetical protein E7597_03980 [Ruminococcaceae bacterium]|nr:hypothetical protein [Oscillospiraceae bacterium]
MNKELVLKVIKTKPGKTAIVFIALSVFSLCGGFVDIANIGAGLFGCALFFVIGAVFFNKGKKEVENPASTSASVPGSSAPYTSAPIQPKFKPTKKVEKYFYVDEVNKQWCVPCSKESKAVYNFSDLLDFELIENGNTVTGGSIGRAIAGGLIFGERGAVIGGMTGKQKQTCNKLQIKITVKDLKHPALFITFIDFEVKKDGIIYRETIKSVEEIASLLQVIKSMNE